MSEARPDFKRMLVRLPPSTRDYAAVGVAAQLAELLGASLEAIFVQDAELADVAALPCVRELRPLGGGWHPIDRLQLDRQLERAAATARRLFDDAIRSTRIETSFTVARRSVADAIGSSTTDDIIVIIEPRNPAERITQQFDRLIEVAFGASVAVMVLPSRIARTSGPIVAVMTGPDDPSIRSAIAVAAAAKESVITIGPLGSSAWEASSQYARAAGVRIEAGPCIQEPSDLVRLLPQLGRLNERMFVVSRGAVIDWHVPTIASLRRVPVLLAPVAVTR